MASQFSTRSTYLTRLTLSRAPRTLLLLHLAFALFVVAPNASVSVASAQTNEKVGIQRPAPEIERRADEIEEAPPPPAPPARRSATENSTTNDGARPTPTPAADPIGGLFAVGSTVLNSVARPLQGDPYAPFRNARYTNEGLLSERDEIRLGAEVHARVQQRYKLTNEGQERATRIGQRVARASLRPNLPYHFYVVQDDALNAFSTPGGYIYVTTGLLKAANDDELASVLAHEVGHVVARHSLQTMKQSQAFDDLAGLFGSVTGLAGETAGGLGTLAARMVGAGLLSAHNREEEREADYLAVRGMKKAGFDTNAMITMFQKIQRLDRAGQSDLIGSIFADHPNVDERIENTRYEIDRLKTPARPRRR